jgi:hypothetical protein
MEVSSSILTPTNLCAIHAGCVDAPGVIVVAVGYRTPCHASTRTELRVALDFWNKAPVSKISDFNH